MNKVKLTLTPEEMYYFAIQIAKAGEKNINASITKNWCKKVIESYSSDLE